MLPRVCRSVLVVLFLSTTPLFAQWPATPHTISLGKGLISEIGLSPDDVVLRLTTSAGVWLHDSRTLELRHLLEETVQFSLFSGDGQRLAAALGDTSVVVVDVGSGRVVTRISTRFTDRLTALSFDRVGARVAAGRRQRTSIVPTTRSSTPSGSPTTRAAPCDSAGSSVSPSSAFWIQRIDPAHQSSILAPCRIDSMPPLPPPDNSSDSHRTYPSTSPSASPKPPHCGV